MRPGDDSFLVTPRTRAWLVLAFWMLVPWRDTPVPGLFTLLPLLFTLVWFFEPLI